jgi:hypothetical protein
MTSLSAKQIRKIVLDQSWRARVVHLMVRPGIRRWRIEPILRETRIHELDLLASTARKADCRDDFKHWDGNPI